MGITRGQRLSGIEAFAEDWTSEETIDVIRAALKHRSNTWRANVIQMLLLRENKTDPSLVNDVKEFLNHE